MTSKSSINIVLVLIAIILWGLSNVLEKKCVIYSNPPTVTIILASLAFIIDIPIAMLILHKTQTAFVINREVMLLGFLEGLCITIASLATLYLLRDNRAGWTASVTSVYPIITLALSVVFLNEKITASNIIGILVVSIGMTILNY